MDAVEQLKDDVRQGRIDPIRLVDLLVSVQRQLQATTQQLAEAKQRIQELEQKFGVAATAKVDAPFSVRAEEKRQEKRGKKKRGKQQRGRRGRRNSQDKIARAQRSEAVYPTDVPPSACSLSHVRPVWRLENGRAVLVAYQVYRGPNQRYGKIPGVLGRSEFGLEIVTEIAYLVYIVGLSFDKVCLLLQFFQELEVSKAQVDALLYRLSRHWEREFDALCTLLANSLLVHGDETRWSLNSVWALLSEKARVLLFGVHKDGDTLHQILDPATFTGIVFSDDAAVYAFSKGQKCWAHLLRKAIKLTLQDPSNAAYRDFTDRLLAIYQKARRVQRDQRLSDVGRSRKVVTLDDELFDLCAALSFAETTPADGLEHDFRLLVQEVIRLQFADELFTFVTMPVVTQPNGATKPVDGTNNEAERTLRGPATARATGRTNKTLRGARRQTIVTSVLESLRLYLRTFTLSSVIVELQRWWTAGQSCFAAHAAKLGLSLPEESVLDRILPSPSG
jgi:transposase